jgi:hypothetical protein
MFGQEAPFDVFISYRVASDGDVADALYHHLKSEYGLNVWMDKYCLESGKSWEKGFCEGLAKSSHFIALLSLDGMWNSERQNQNYGKLTVASSCDNCLLEWRLAIELAERGLIEGIFPLFIGQKQLSNDASTFTNFFKSAAQRQLPPLLQDSVISIEQKLSQYLDQLGYGTPFLTGKDSTVKTIYDRILSNQGGFLEGEQSDAFRRLGASIFQMVENSKLARARSFSHL